MKKTRAELTKNKHLYISILICIVVFLFFYPSFYTSNDERQYIQDAYYLNTQGVDGLIRDDVTCEGDGSEAYGFTVPKEALAQKEGCISKYNLGTSIILIPFVAINWQLSFLATILFFLISIIFVYKSLKLLEISSWWIYFYALYPLFSYYSHKVMSEIFTVGFVSILIYILIKSRLINLSARYFTLFGALCGFVVITRYTNIIIVLPLVFISLYSKKTSAKDIFNKLLYIAIGASPFLLFFITTNLYFYGGLFKSGYSLAGEEFFWNLNLFSKQIPHYLVYFNLLYPGLLILLTSSLLIKKIRDKWLIILSVILLSFYLLFYSGFDGFNFNQGINNLIFSLRFFLPIAPIFLIAYFSVADNILKRMKFNTKLKAILVLLAVIALIGAKVIISHQLKSRLNELRAQSDYLYDTYNQSDLIPQPYILINDAFNKGKRYVKKDIWVPPFKREY